MRILFISLIFVFLACSKSTEPITPLVQINGTVFDESIDKPINNILMHLNRINQDNASAIIDSIRTDKDGKFHFEYELLDKSKFTLELWINLLFRNSKYSSKFTEIPVNSTTNKNIFLYEYTELELVLKTDNPLSTSDRFQIDLPGVSTGGFGPIQDTLFGARAKGNFYNQIKFTYDRNGVNHTLLDSAYCPIETKTRIVINY